MSSSSNNHNIIVIVIKKKTKEWEEEALSQEYLALHQKDLRGVPLDLH